MKSRDAVRLGSGLLHAEEIIGPVEKGLPVQEKPEARKADLAIVLRLNSPNAFIVYIQRDFIIISKRLSFHE